MTIVGWSVELAGWGDLPSVIPTLVLGTTVSFVLSRFNLGRYLPVVLALILGFCVSIWQGSADAIGADPVSRAGDSFARLVSWVNVAQSGGISTDTVPFALMFMTASWIVGYGVTSLTFRFRLPWLPTSLLSLIILTNLSYRHGEHELTFFLFLIAGIVLFAHMSTVRRFQTWQSEDITYPRYLGWVTVQEGLLFAVPIVVLSMVIPLWEPRSDQLEDTWDVIRSPLYALRDPANRLLGGVDSPLKGDMLSVPSESRVFKGPVSLTDEPLMWVRSKYVVPYAGRIYQRYTSEGWLTDPSVKIRVEPESPLTEPTDTLEKEGVSQVYVPLIDTKAVVPAGSVFSVNREAQFQVLTPLKWRVPLAGPTVLPDELPPDLKEFSLSVRSALHDLELGETFVGYGMTPEHMTERETVEQVINGLMAATSSGKPQVIKRTVKPKHPDLRNTAGLDKTLETTLLPVETDTRNLNWGALSISVGTDHQTRMGLWLEFERDTPLEQVGVELTQKISQDDTFYINTFISHATDKQLNNSGTNYPASVTDRYLQLPSSLPPQVESLAAQIVNDSGAITPFEKAESIQAFLSNQEYSLEIQGPELGVDGIYYFLFQTQAEPCPGTNSNCDIAKAKGYSEYFGSAATVLLRATGVPARYVAGWGPGEYVPDAGLFLVRDRDRHGWTQVYFPGYGWIDYEVTPGRIVVTRGQLPAARTDTSHLGPGAVGSFEEDPDFLLFLSDIEDLEYLEDELKGNFAGKLDPSGQETFIYKLRLYIFGIVTAVLILLATLIWWLTFRGMDPPAKAYARINRIASLVRMNRRPQQTVKEYATNLSEKVPGSRESVNLIATEFERSIYARSNNNSAFDRAMSRQLDRAWKSCAAALILYRVRQLVGIEPKP